MFLGPGLWSRFELGRALVRIGSRSLNPQKATLDPVPTFPAKSVHFQKLLTFIVHSVFQVGFRALGFIGFGPVWGFEVGVDCIGVWMLSLFQRKTVECPYLLVRGLGKSGF